MSHTDEQQFADAVRHRARITDLPDFAAVEVAARRQGGRLRLRRRASVAAASLAVAAIAGGGVWAAAGQSDRPAGSGNDIGGFAGQTTPTATPSEAASPSVAASALCTECSSSAPGAPDLSAAYAVLEAPGWSAPDGFGDEKAYYVRGQDSVSLNWRPAADYSPKYTAGRVVATTTIDGDPAEVHADGTVVGPVRAGRFLTLSGSSGLTTADLVELATQVHRQPR